MTWMLNPKTWLVLILSAVFCASHLIAYRLGRGAVQSAWDAQTTAQARATLRIMDSAWAAEAAMQDKADQRTKAKNEQIKRLNADLGAALERLRDRPERPSGADLPTVASTESSCTGASLYRPDGEFLIRESARADKLRLDLIECQGAYQAASAVN